MGLQQIPDDSRVSQAIGDPSSLHVCGLGRTAYLPATLPHIRAILSNVCIRHLDLYKDLY